MLSSLLMSAELWIGIIGILGTLLGWWVKRWWVNQAAKEQTEQRQKEEQKGADEHEQRWADEAAKKAQDKLKQDASFAKWSDGAGGDR